VDRQRKLILSENTSAYLPRLSPALRYEITLRVNDYGRNIYLNDMRLFHKSHTLQASVVQGVKNYISIFEK
jgi:hypothetical protein